MRLNPYSNLNNPANFVPYNGYVGIPGISNISFSIYNTSFIYKKLVTTNKKGVPVKFTTTKFINSLAKANWFNTGLNLEVIGFGFRVKDYFFTFSYRVKYDESFRYSKDLFGFLLPGNLAQNSKGDYIFTKDSPALLKIEPKLNIYHEYCLGFQGKILDDLYIGASTKFLFGIFNLNSKKLNAKVYTDPTDYTIYGQYDMDLKIASVLPYYKKDDDEKVQLDLESIFNSGIGVSKIINNCFTQNAGFAIDLGAVYRINQEIRVGASITDLGFICWRGSPLSIKPLDKTYYEFSGFNNDQFKDLIENFNINFDTIINNNFSLKSIKSYTTMITSKIMVEGYFDLTPCNRFIMQVKGYILGKFFLPQLTVAYNGTFFESIDVVVSYSLMKRSFANLGIGLGFRMGPVHLYLGTDNVLAPINIFNARQANATVGLLVDFPYKIKVKETELKSLSLFIKDETKEPKPPKEKKKKKTDDSFQSDDGLFQPGDE